MAKPLSEYNRKRNFNLTSEPPLDESLKPNSDADHPLTFVIQKHDARRLHYDFRLELGGTLKSWAIPKGPSLDPKDKRLAVQVEDHPLEYATFEGNIPEGQYGGGDVIVWDQGIWQPQGDPNQGYQAGKLKFILKGKKVSGEWNLVRTQLPGSSDKAQWLLIKEQDASARPAQEYDLVEAEPQSVLSGAVLPMDKTKYASAGPLSSAKKSSMKKSSAALKSKLAETLSAHPKNSDIKPPSKRPKKVELPEQFSPELATLVSEPPAGEWLYEIKFDGYRILARIMNSQVRLFTRVGNDWTERLPAQVEALAKLELGDSWLDGEVVVLNDKGLPDFQSLQNAFDVGRSHHIVYYLFDAPFLNGEDLRALPVETRRAALEQILSDQDAGPLRFSAAFGADHRDIVASACSMSLEGVIGKRAGSPYVSRRSGDWIKLKCRLRQEFVIVGYTQPQGNRSGFGALLVGVYAQAGQPELLYAGRVGTGFSAAQLKELYNQLRQLERATSPLTTTLTSTQARGVQWVEPQLVCELEFAEWTSEGVLRQAAFISLRSDKPPVDIIRENPRLPAEVIPEAESLLDPSPTMKAPQKTKNQGAFAMNKTTRRADLAVAPQKKRTEAAMPAQVANITISHPDRVVDVDSGATKKDIALFYGAIAQWILPHLNDRPVSILRAPDGVAGEQFFQKHAEHLAIPHIKHLDPALDPGHARLMEIDTVEALVGAVQMGTIEVHTWGALSSSIDTPDRIVLDLDPDPKLPWRAVVEATRLTLAVLDELKLDAFLKTSGGKGMHIVIPLKRQPNWDTIKEFSKAIAEFMSRQIPERFVAKMGPKNRVGKIFIDYLRNQRGASTVAAYSLRARPGLPVSVPISLEELDELSHSGHWTIANLTERLASLGRDPWADYQHRQRITQMMWKKLGAKSP